MKSKQTKVGEVTHGAHSLTIRQRLRSNIMDNNDSHLPRIDRLARTISKDPSKVKETIMLLDALVEIALSGNIEGLGLQATAGRRFLEKNLED